jgi:hypothetical protein
MILTNSLVGDNVQPALWSLIEINMAIICACIPAVRGLVARYIPKFRLDTIQSRSRKTSNTLPSFSTVRQQHARISSRDSELKIVTHTYHESVSTRFSESGISPLSKEGMSPQSNMWRQSRVGSWDGLMIP